MSQKLEDLKSLEGYLEFLINKHGDLSLPSWARNGKIPGKSATKEITRVSKRIHELSYCSRHGGIEGVDCCPCKLEGVLNK